MRTGSPRGTILAASDLGTVDYIESAAMQDRLRSARVSGASPDLLLLVEHPPVFTCGRRTSRTEIPSSSAAAGIPVVEADRGGRVTFHGPGQLVAYPILSLHVLGGDVTLLVRRLEGAALGVLASLGIGGTRRNGMPGIFVGDRKIASVGLRVKRGVTTHGIALNSSIDLEPFGRISPCGVPDLEVTSIARELGEAPPMPALKRAFARSFAQTFAFRLEWLAAPELPGDTCDRVPVSAVAAREAASTR